MPTMQTLRLTHPDLDFWVDVRVREFLGRWLAVAVLADEPEVGLGWTPQDAVAEALSLLSDDLASEMAARAALG